jgi:hypothetical protein
MNEEATHLSSAPKHVSFNHSVEMIDDSGVEYVDLPPIIIETLNESDSMMSFTELTETSDQYYDETPQLATLPREQQYSNFGEASMSFSDLYTSDDDYIDTQDVPATVLPAHDQSDGTTPVDDDDDDDDDGPPEEPADSSWMWLRFLAAFAAMSGAVGKIMHCFSSRQQPADNDDVAAGAMAHTGTAGKGFLIPSLVPDGGVTYIT